MAKIGRGNHHRSCVETQGRQTDASKRSRVTCSRHDLIWQLPFPAALLRLRVLMSW